MTHNGSMSTAGDVHRKRYADGRARESGPLKVGLVTQWFPPEPVTIPLWTAKALRAQGLAVRILTGYPNYPTGVVHAGYQSYRPMRDRLDGFDVLRVPLVPSHSSSATGRTMNYSSFALTASSAGASMLGGSDVNLVYGSPATAAIPAVAALIRSRVPYAIVVQDLWPDSIFATGFLRQGRRNRTRNAWLLNATNQLYRRAACVCIISPGVREILVERGVSDRRIHLLYNWVDEQIIQPSPPDAKLRETLGLTKEFIVMYSGAHGPAQSLHTVIAAIELLNDVPDLHLVLLGAGISKDSLKNQAAMSPARDRIHFLESVPKNCMPGLMAAADLQLVTLADNPLFRVTMPSKIQSIMACGRPSLVVAAGDPAALIIEADAGFVASPGDPMSIARALRAAYSIRGAELERMGDSALAYYRSYMSEQVSAPRLAGLLHSVSRDDSSPEPLTLRRRYRPIRVS